MQPICIEKKNLPHMPSNLNALIRYKTIDRCLSNPYREWSIDDLREACSRALAESRGTGSGISERTIREDIRVMRSDILGFNAPIVQSGGHYSYKDRDYSIFNVVTGDRGLLSRILEFILDIRSEVDHPEMDLIIERIEEAISRSGPAEEPGPALSAPGMVKDNLVEEEPDGLQVSESRISFAVIGWAWILERMDPIIQH